MLVIDMQNDFVTGVLGSEEARKIVIPMRQRLQQAKCPIWFTMDTHGPDYASDPEARHLPIPHCVEGTQGWAVVDALAPFWEKGEKISKPTFGSMELAKRVIGMPSLKKVEMMGVCTDICVVSNALLLKAARPDLVITVDKALCAGSSPASHQAALDVMKSCHIDII